MAVSKLALFGEGISQSLSSVIHHAFAREAGIEIDYSLLETSKMAFDANWHQFIRQGGMGANITAPLKQAAFSLVHAMTSRAVRAKAINTIYQNEGAWIGDNTDGVGFGLDLQRLDIDLTQKKILILGAGGAVRGILDVILKYHPKQVVIANRTLETAHGLIHDFASAFKVVGLSDLQHEMAFDVIIHATFNAAAVLPFLPSALLHQDTFFYDLNYGEKAKASQAFAARSAVSYCDGLGMLIYQAAESFYLWFGVRPNAPLDVLLPTLNNGLHCSQ